MSTYFALLCIASFALSSFGVKLPSYIEKCSFENVNECILKQTSKVIPEIVKGYRPLHIPPLDPYHITKLSIQATRFLNLTLTDLDVYGLGNSKFEKLDVDAEKRTTLAKISVQHIEVIGTYNATGKILLLDIVGNGPINITAINSMFTYTFDWELYQKADGNTYYKNRNGKVDYNMERMYFHLDNLFNGNKELGDQMNKFINENWNEFAHDIYPALTKTISDIITKLFNAFDVIPLSELALQ